MFSPASIDHVSMPLREAYDDGDSTLPYTGSELWRERIRIPTYRVGDAARYAGISAQTVAYWQRLRGGGSSVLSQRPKGLALSYLQLIEVGVVAAMRKSGVKLQTIDATRTYLSEQIGTEFPFAEYRFKTDGKQLLIDMKQIDPNAPADVLLDTGSGGQLAWNLILESLLSEFEYNPDGDFVRLWRVAGREQPIRIDPAIAFGAPHVGGIATWVVKERWEGGENVAEIAEDFALDVCKVSAALKFEKVEVDIGRPGSWAS